MLRLIDTVHKLPKEEEEALRQCANYLKLLGQPLIATEVFEKLDDKWAIVTVYMETKHWDMVRKC